MNNMVERRNDKGAKGQNDNLCNRNYSRDAAGLSSAELKAFMTSMTFHFNRHRGTHAHAHT